MAPGRVSGTSRVQSVNAVTIINNVLARTEQRLTTRWELGGTNPMHVVFITSWPLQVMTVLQIGPALEIVAPMNCGFNPRLSLNNKIWRPIKEENMFALESFQSSVEPCVDWIAASFPRAWQSPQCRRTELRSPQDALVQKAAKTHSWLCVRPPGSL